MLDLPGRVLARGSAGALAAVAVAAALASWFVDATVTWATEAGRAFADVLLRPMLHELWTRLVIAVLLVLLHRLATARRRLYLLSSALARAPDGIQITGLDGRIAYSNEAVRDLYGFSPEELAGKHVDTLNADPAFASAVILPALARDGRWEGEIEVKHKDGHTFPIWLTTSLVLDRRRRPVAAVGAIRDVSERKRTEHELREHARRLEDATALKDLFADILRHDLVGPAATVQLSLDSLLKRDPDPEAARRIIEGARRSCAKLIDMIEGAAKYAKLSTPQEIEFGTIELGALLKEIVAESELRRQARDARIVLSAGREHTVRANPMIADVFENLLSNALKYGPPDGTVRIEVHDDRDRWRVSVANAGEGIPDADKQKLFTRFERLRKESVKGTGLGLAIAKRIVDLHGGSIWVEDNPGGGCVFCVSLAKAAAGPQGAASPPSSPLPPPR